MEVRPWKSGQDTPVDELDDLLRNSLSAVRREAPRVAGDLSGLVMDWSKAADMRPKDMYARRCPSMPSTGFSGTARPSTARIYDSTIGLFIGPTLLAMEGKKHRQHRNLVSAAFKSKSLQRWEPQIVRPVVNALIDRFIDDGGRPGQTVHLRVPPTRVITKLLGLPEEDLPWFRQRAIELISYHPLPARVRGVGGAERLFPATDRAAPVGPTEDIIGDLW